MNKENRSSVLPFEKKLEQAAKSQRARTILNQLQFWGVILVALSLTIVISFILNSYWEQGHNDLEYLARYLTLFCILVFTLVGSMSITFWPIIFFIFAMSQDQRRQSLLTLVRNGLQSKLPLAGLVRTYAVSRVSYFYRRSLYKFASMLERGQSLQEAAFRCPGLFPADFVPMIQIQEDSPQAITMIDDTLTSMGNRAYIQSFSINRFTYLLLLATNFINIIVFTKLLIIPEFMEIFGYFDTEIPAFSKWFFNLFSNNAIFLLLISYPFLLLFLVLAWLFFFMKLGIMRRRPCFLRLFFEDSDTAQFLHVLSAGVKKGIPLPHTIALYERTVKSRSLQQRAGNIRKKLEAGQPWIPVLRRYNFLNTEEAALLDSAEKAHNTAFMLHELAATREAKQNRKDDLWSKLMFTLIILGAGLFVGAFALASFTPMFHLIEVLT